MRLVVASRNAGKLVEVRSLLVDQHLEVLSMTEAGVDLALELREDGATFEANALAKAKQLQDRIGGCTLADDSGLSVDALRGEPGVRSARYAGVVGTAVERDRANILKLLSALEPVPDPARTARFVCALCLLGPSGESIEARGTCEGVILRSMRGEGGFGYDPVFLPEGFDRTMAELDLAEKNRISHRGRALRALLQRIRARGGLTALAQ